MIVILTVRRLARRISPIVAIGAAVSASAMLLALPTPARHVPTAPVAVALAWPNAKRAAIPADLPDGTAYEPGLFLNAGTSIGSAPTRDGKAVRLLLRRSDGSVQEIRRLSQKRYPSFSVITAAGDVLVWLEQSATGPAALWTASLRRGGARLLTTDVGDIGLNTSDYDLVIAAGRVYWVTGGVANTTTVRSVRLSGGAVDAQREAGNWKLSAWPWLVNGVSETAGATALRNLVTGQVRTVPPTAHGSARCGPTWCRVITLDADGTAVELMRTDGAHRERINDATMAAPLTDPATLDRFEILAQIGDNTALTNHVQLVVYEISTRRLVVISPDAFDVNCRAGVLWWSTGTDDAFVRHALDLRTV